MGVDLADACREHIHALLQLLAQIGEFGFLEQRRARDARRAAIAELGALTEREARAEDAAQEQQHAAGDRALHPRRGEVEAHDARRPLPQQREAHVRDSDARAWRILRFAALDDGIVTPR